MNDKFDELAKSMAQSVTRRAALKKFGLGLTGVVLAAFGLGNDANAVQAAPSPCWRAGFTCAKTDSAAARAHCRDVCCSHRFNVQINPETGARSLRCA